MTRRPLLLTLTLALLIVLTAASSASAAQTFGRLDRGSTVEMQGAKTFRAADGSYWALDPNQTNPDDVYSGVIVHRSAEGQLLGSFNPSGRNKYVGAPATETPEGRTSFIRPRAGTNEVLVGRNGCIIQRYIDGSLVNDWDGCDPTKQENDLEVGPDGTVYVAADGHVWMWSDTGVFIDYLGDPPFTLSSNVEVAVAEDGRQVVYRPSDGLTRVFATDHTQVASFMLASGASDVAFLSDGTIALAGSAIDLYDGGTGAQLTHWVAPPGNSSGSGQDDDYLNYAYGSFTEASAGPAGTLYVSNTAFEADLSFQFGYGEMATISVEPDSLLPTSIGGWRNSAILSVDGVWDRVEYRIDGGSWTYPYAYTFDTGTSYSGCDALSRVFAANEGCIDYGAFEWDTSHTLEIRACSQSDCDTFSKTWAPNPTLEWTETPASWLDAATPQSRFQWRLSDPGANTETNPTADCWLNGSKLASCGGSPLTVTAREGRNTLRVEACGGASCRDLTHTWYMGAPTTTITEQPPAQDDGATSTFKWTISGAIGHWRTPECRVDGGAWNTCTGGQKSYGSLTPGMHTFEVRACYTDDPRSCGIDSYTWERLTPSGPAAPQVKLDPVPANVQQGTDLTFSWDSSMGGSVDTTECRLDEEAWAPCSSPTVRGTSALGLGTHAFAVRVTGPGGEATDTASFSVEATEPGVTPPTVRIDDASKPANPSAEASANFTWTLSGDPADTVDCRLDMGTYEPCAGAKSYSALSASPHLFEVRACNAAGCNTDSYSWSVSGGGGGMPLSVVITMRPSTPTTDSTASFNWMPSGPVVSYTCELDGSLPAPCSGDPLMTTKSYAGLGAGMHTFRVSACSGMYTGCTASDSYTWQVMASPTLGVVITEKPANPTTSDVADFAWLPTGGGTVLGYRCQLDDGPSTPCNPVPNATSKRYTGLTPGEHTFTVSACSSPFSCPGSDTYTWTVKADEPPPSAPVVRLTEKPATRTTKTKADLKWSLSGGPTAQTECKLDDASFAACDSGDATATAKSYEGLTLGQHTFTVRASGPGGSDSETYTWTVEKMHDEPNPEQPGPETPEPPKVCANPSLVQPEPRRIRAGSVVRVSGNDLGASGTVRIAGRQAQVVSWSASQVEAVVPGDLRGTVKMVADCGKSTNEVELDVINHAPEPEIAPKPDKTKKGERPSDRYTLIGFAKDPDGDPIVRWQWEVEDAKGKLRVVSTKRNLVWRFPWTRERAKRGYKVRLTVWDNHGASGTTMKPVIPRKPPTVRVSVPATCFFANDKYRAGMRCLKLLRSLRPLVKGAERVTLEGYASRPASSAYNRRLSRKRVAWVEKRVLYRYSRGKWLKLRPAPKKVIRRYYGESKAKERAWSRMWRDRKVVITIRYDKRVTATKAGSRTSKSGGNKVSRKKVAR